MSFQVVKQSKARTAFSMMMLSCILVLTAQTLQAFPQPELTSSEWEFEFKQSDIRTIAIKKPEGGFRWYWFITYSVLNNTKDPQIFAPDFTVMTDVGKVLKPNHGVDKGVFDAIKRKIGNTLLERPVDVVGTFLPGRDHIKESVIVWEVPVKHTSRMTLFIGGLSGEVQRMTTERKLKVTKKSGDVVFDGPLVYQKHRRKMPRTFDRKVKWMDLTIEQLKAIKAPGDKIIAGNGRTGDVKVLDDRWVVSYSDLDHDIELVQLKKGKGQILRKQMMIQYELPGRATSPQLQSVVLVSKAWVMR